jgi:hypothetical protein
MLLYWDDLDMAYFACYAFWNYLTLPALLLNDRITWSEIAQGVLQADFPSEIPTHSGRQTFIFDRQSGELKQHNYTAEIISKLATAANVVHAHLHADRVPYPSHRIVTPMRSSGKPLGWPRLIEIHMRNLRFIR